MNPTCKHNEPKGYCEKCFTEKWGEVCQICGIRKVTFAASMSGTSGGKEGGRDSICKCDRI